MHVHELDHIVLRVGDVERSLAWYTGLLGLEGIRVAEWRAGDVSFPSVRVTDGCIIDLFGADQLADGSANLDHFCLVVDRADVDATTDDARFTVVDGPGPRFGARGDGWSVYVADPDGNTVELRSYPPGDG